MARLADSTEDDDYLFNHLIAIQSYDTVPKLLDFPLCVTADPHTNRIYVVDGLALYMCVLIYSESGEFVNLFLEKGLRYPISIAIHQDNIYITLSETPFLVHFKVFANGLHLIRSKEDMGSNVDKSCHVRKLAVSNNGDVFVTDFGEHNIQVFDGELHYKRQISHYSMVNPIDVKLTADEVFVLCFNSLHPHHCIIAFNQMGNKLRSIILRGLEFYQSENPFPFPVFCLDSIGNFIISDVKTNEVKFFTKEGTLFQKFGEFGEDPGMFNTIAGLTLTANRKLVVVSMWGEYKLQIFSYV